MVTPHSQDTVLNQDIQLNLAIQRSRATQLSQEPTGSHSRHTPLKERELSDSHNREWQDTANSLTDNRCKTPTPVNR